MHVAYEAENALDAHLIKNLLTQAGIAAQIRGEYLLGAMGELPAIGLVAVLVDAADLERARGLIADWQKAVPELEPELEPEQAAEQDEARAASDEALLPGSGYLRA